MKINVLTPQIYNRIAAGEVVERPASVVKELVENSIDAGATHIKIEILNGGIKEITVTDNGSGIEKDDLPLAFMPHATSKIKDVDDLDTIATLGFRGEALASIASVSMVRLSTKTESADSGYMIEANGGDISKVSEIAFSKGTCLSVRNLFYNTPARAKFLKRPKLEEGEITSLVEKFMLAHPEISFEYYTDEKCVYNYSLGSLKDVIYLIYGREIYENLLDVNYSVDGVEVSGYVCGPKVSRPNRTYQTLFVNGRYVINYQISACVQSVYEHFLMKNRFPIYILNIKVPYDRVDVNVHPNKKEVKFQENSKVFIVVRKAIENALVATNLIADFVADEKAEKDFSKFSIENDENPMRTSFDTELRFNKLAQNEGKSFNVSLDTEDKEIITPSKLQEKGIDIINMPNFSSIKSDDKKKNKPGGYIFFDQEEKRLIQEVDLSEAPKKMEVEKIEETQSSNEEEKFLTEKSEIQIVGVIFKTYILTEFGDSVYVIDQHAMHERQLYDKLKKQIDEKEITRQDLLFPYEFSLQHEDAEKFTEKIPNLQELGFVVEEHGQDFKIKSVPFLLSGISLGKFVEDILGDETLGDKKASGFINEKLCQTACKHAIRAGDSVTKDEISYLIEEMKKGVLLCPHGRPIIVRITKKDFEKMFKRVL